MSDEIKEILDRLKGQDNDYHYCLKKDISFNDNMYCSHILLDYITNLQQKEELLRQEISDVRKAFNSLQHKISLMEEDIRESKGG